MNIGKRDRQVTLESPAVVAKNVYGESQPAAWVSQGVEWAAVAYKTGDESILAAERTPTQRIQFTLRYRADVRPVWRLHYEGKTFNITDVAEIGRRQGTLITCYSHG